MANMSYGVNIIPKTNNTYTLGNSNYKWSNIYTTQLNGTDISGLATTATTSIAGLMSAADKTKLDGIATGANKPVILTYGTSTWNDFITAYTSGATVYCYTEAQDEGQYRIAQLTYANNKTNPTLVQFQYYRSKSGKTTSSLCDELFQYSLDSTNGWSTYVRYTGPNTITATNGISISFSNYDMTISGVEATTSTAGIMSATDKTKLDGIATGATADTVMTGATSSVAGTSGLVPAPATTDVDKFLAGDGTYKSGGLPMVILSYGNSTWNDFLNAYNNNVIVYCRASNATDPASGNQTRLAFMAYVNNGTNPTEVEFQYYRSISSHNITTMGDEVYVYKLTSSNVWTVTKRYASIREIKVGTSGNLSVSWSNNQVTIDGGLPAVTSNDNGKILKVVNGAWALVTP